MDTPNDKILELIKSEYAWEQVLQQIVATEGLDPWDLDLSQLSKVFLQYLAHLRELDFSIPAKYVIISAVILKIKSKRLPILPAEDDDELGFDFPEDAFTEAQHRVRNDELTPLTAQPARVTRRKVMLGELIDALRKAIRTEDRRTLRVLTHHGKMQIKKDDTTHRIQGLYDRISGLLAKIKGEVTFSSLVQEQTRDGVTNTFLPLVYLDHSQHVSCRQEDLFQEIYITPGPKHGTPLPIPAQLKKKQEKET
ncbi:MAG: segregation/condensation protein A [Nanoarchaeota archaeon]|nr:segregation/condensation protein A [Nanoarchaeota archaeon]